MPSRPSPAEFFRQSLKSDARYADEIINIYLLRPVAAGLVWLVYPTPVTPNQVTIAAVILGIAAAFVYLIGTPAAIAVAGILVMLKDIVDDADGQLARAKQLYSRRGRFLDSIGDFIVDAALFSAITIVVYRESASLWSFPAGLAALAGITLRVSYHVFHQVSFLHRENRYKLNRIVEDISEEDRAGDPVALNLQRIFLLIYGWQDRLMLGIDRWCRNGREEHNFLGGWYTDRTGMRLSGLTGFGTELALLTACSLAQNLQLYLLLNLVLMNGIILSSILYRKFILAKRLA